MKLDATGRTLRAKNAALVQVKYRQEKSRIRDDELIKAFRLLIGFRQSKKDREAGITFLRRHGLPPYLPNEESVWNLLAKATCLTSKRIRQIIKLKDKALYLAHFPQKEMVQLKLL